MSVRTLALGIAGLTPFLLFAGRDKTLTPGFAENASLSLSATAYVDKASIQQALGTDLNGYFTVLQVTLSPKAGKLNVHRDDFLLRTAKDGEHTTPMAPSQIAGSADIIVRQVGVGRGGGGAENTGPVFGGIPGSGGMPMQLPGNGQMAGNGAGGTATTASVNKAAKGKADPMLEVLKQKVLPEKETDQPVSGFLIFNLEKQKLKDLELVYTTPEGPLKVRFR